MVHLARNGDLGAFAELCQRHSWTAWETAYAVTGDTSDAAEAVSEAFARMFKPGRVARYEDAQALQSAILSNTRAAAIETVGQLCPEGASAAFRRGDADADALVRKATRAARARCHK